MSLDNREIGCQLPSLQRVAEGVGEVPQQSLTRRLKLAIRRRLTPLSEREFKRRTNDWMNRVCRLTGGQSRPAAVANPSSTGQIGAGDPVRVRSLSEIEATLNHWRQLRGCTFMPEMEQYCGTNQRVLKRVERFVDERDLCVRTSRGIILLQGLTCQGTADFGRCDRACHYFWREEWLERIDRVAAPAPAPESGRVAGAANEPNTKSTLVLSVAPPVDG